MITFYLLLELIIQMHILAVNISAHHAEQVIIMLKDVLYVKHIKFLLEAFNDDSDIETERKTQAVITNYEHEKNISELTSAQQNKINAILIIRNFEYVTYHSDLSLEDIK